MSGGGELQSAAERLANVGRLLIASDFDGTLAPLTDRPSEARMAPIATIALALLARCRETMVVIITGRDLASLHAACPPIPGVVGIGSYGAQWPGVTPALSESQRRTLDTLAHGLDQIVAPIQGAFIERKAVSAAMNVRIADIDAAAKAMDDAHALAANMQGLTRHLGKGVVEWSVHPTRKRDVLATLRRDFAADVTVALGDDEPDLEAFDVLDEADVRIFVSPQGRPRTLAVATPVEAAIWLEELADLRMAAVGAAPLPPVPAITETHAGSPARTSSQHRHHEPASPHEPAKS